MTFSTSETIAVEPGQVIRQASKSCRERPVSRQEPMGRGLDRPSSARLREGDILATRVSTLKGWEVHDSLSDAKGDLLAALVAPSEDSSSSDLICAGMVSPKASSSTCSLGRETVEESGESSCGVADERWGGAPTSDRPPYPSCKPVMPQCLEQICNEPPVAAADDEDEEQTVGQVLESPGTEHHPTYIRPPTFPGTSSTVAFSADPTSFLRDGCVALKKKKMWVRFGGIANSPVKNAIQLAGLRRTKSSHFNLFWTAALGRDSSWWKVVNKHQRINHFPGTWELGRKDKLYRNVAAARRQKGSEFDFVPRFFILPREFDEFKQHIERHPDALYIQKPLASSRGRGIRMVVKPREMPKDSNCLVQHYIRNPLTINGHKFDIRLYCVVTCFDPLKVYLFDDGLARFATEKYSSDTNQLKKRCVHLTNYSVNKKKDAFQQEESDEDGVGFKWSMSALRKYLEDQGTPWSVVWDQFRAIVAKTIIAVEPKINTLVKMVVPHRNICFEVYGFDIMLDSNLRAWLIEVNTGPSLGATGVGSHVDKKVKFPMVADMLNLIGLQPYERAAFEREQEEKKQARLTGLGEQQSRVRHRDVREAQESDFTGLSPHELPDVVQEAEAELARRGGFHRVFPVPEDPCRYLDLFDAPRYDTTVVCRYYDQKKSGFTGPATGRAGPGASTSRRLLSAAMSRSASSSSLGSVSSSSASAGRLASASPAGNSMRSIAKGRRRPPAASSSGAATSQGGGASSPRGRTLSRTGSGTMMGSVRSSSIGRASGRPREASASGAPPTPPRRSSSTAKVRGVTGRVRPVKAAA